MEESSTQEDFSKYEEVEGAPSEITFKDMRSSPCLLASSGVLPWRDGMNWWGGLISLRLNLTPLAYVPFGLLKPCAELFADRAEFLGARSRFQSECPRAIELPRELGKATVWKSRFERRLRLVELFRSMANSTVGDHTILFHKDSEGKPSRWLYTWKIATAWQWDRISSVLFSNMKWVTSTALPGMTLSSGQIGSDSNLVASGKRMLFDMTPTIVAKDGKKGLFKWIGKSWRTHDYQYVFQSRPECLSLWHADRRGRSKAMKIHHAVASDQNSIWANLLSAWYAWLCWKKWATPFRPTQTSV